MTRKQKFFSQVVLLTTCVWSIMLITWLAKQPAKTPPTAPVTKPETVKVTVSIPVEADNGKSEIKLFGTLISLTAFGNRNCYNPWDRSCLVNASLEIVNGMMTTTFDVPTETLVDLGDIRNNKMRADGYVISAGGATLSPTDFCVLDNTSRNFDWQVVSFMVKRDKDGNIMLLLNPLCRTPSYRIQVQANGDATHNQFDDVWKPFNGKSEGPIKMFNSLNNSGIVQMHTMTKFIPGSGWVEDFYLNTDMSANIAVYRPSREPTSLPDAIEPMLGGDRAITYAPGTDTPLCISELVHFEKIDTPNGSFYSAIIDGIDPVTRCVIQGPDNRAQIQLEINGTP